MPELDLDALAAVAEAADRCLLSADCNEPTHHWFLKGELIVRFSDGEGEPFAFGPDVDFIATLSPATALTLIAEAREAERLRRGLRDAIDELVECRSFISVETRHYPTVEAINVKVDELRALIGGQ